MSRSAIKEGTAFDAERTQQIIADFRRDGYCVIGGVLDCDEVAALRDALDRSLLAPGDLVLFSSVGAGLTIGTAAIRWGGERTAPASAETNSTGP